MMPGDVRDYPRLRLPTGSPRLRPVVSWCGTAAMTDHDTGPARAELRSADIERLFGADRLWWRALAEAVRSDPGWLAGGEPEQVIGEFADRADDVHAEDDAAALLAAARAAAGVAPERLAEDLATVCRRWREGSLPRRLPANPVLDVAVSHPGLMRAVAALLSDRPDSGPRTMAALTMTLLHQPFPDAGEPLSTHVLFDANPAGVAVRGKAGRLRIVCLPGGPPGLYPDPRYMGFFHGRAGFAASLDHAWAATFGGVAEPPCVLWRLTGTKPADGSPVRMVGGESAGAGFGVLLHHLRRRIERPSGPAAWLTPARNLRGRVALTGTVGDDGRIGRIESAGDKLTAAHAQRLDPILPAANRTDTATVPDRSEPHWVTTIAEAHRIATRWSRTYRRVGAGAAAATVLALVTGGLVYGEFRDRAQTQQQEKIAARLTGAARQLRDADPALAALLAAQAVAQAPGDTAKATATDELVEQLAANGRYAGTVTGNNQRVTATAVAPAQPGGAEIILAGTEDGTLFAADTGRRAVESRYGRAHDRAVTAITVNPSRAGEFASLGADGSVRTWRLTDRRVTPGPQADAPQDAQARTIAYSPDGKLIAAADEKGRIWLVNAADGRMTAQWQPNPALGTAPDVTTVAFGPFGSESFYVGTRTGAVAAVDYRNRRMARLPVPNRGRIRALAVVPGPGREARDPTHVLLIGSDEGLQAWDPAKRADAVPFPVAELSGAVHALAVHGSAVAVSQSSRTHLLFYEGWRGQLYGFHLSDTHNDTLPAAAPYARGLVTPVLGGGIRVWEHERQPLVRTLTIGMIDDAVLDEQGTAYVLDLDGNLSRIAGADRTTINTNIQVFDGRLAVPRTPDLPLVVVNRDTGTQRPLAAFDRTTLQRLDLPEQDHVLASCDGVTVARYLPGAPARLAVGCRSGLVQVWDPATWTVRTQTRLDGAQVTAFARIGDRLIVGGLPDELSEQVGTLTAGAVDDLNGTVTVHANRGGVTGLAEAGEHVVAGGADGTVRAYSAALVPYTPAVTIGGTVRAVAAEPVAGRVVAVTDQSLLLLDPDRLDVLATAGTGRPVTGVSAGATGTVATVFADDSGGSVNDGVPTAQVWRFDRDHLIRQACALGGRDLTPAEVHRFSGDDGAEARPQCPAAPPPTASPSPAASGDTPGGVLAALSGPVQDRVSSGCDSLLTEGGRCDTMVGGEHDYAWTDVPGSEVASDPGNYAHRIVIYQGTVDSAGWQPLLRTADGWAGVDAYVLPVGPEGRRSLAVGHRRAGAGNTTVLTLVSDGHLDRTLPAVAAAEPTDLGVRVWEHVPDGSGVVSYELRRDAHGTWSEYDRKTDVLPR
jgi:WD40 repeat protein